MAKQKTSVTLDPVKLDEVRRITGAKSASAAIDRAFAETIRSARLRSDVEAYAQQPPTDDEIALARMTPDWSDLHDDTDWDAAYRDEAE